MKHCPPTVLTAEDLLLRFEQSGDAGSFSEIVRRYSGMVYGVCYRVTRNAHDAEDATQAVFLKLATQAKTTNGIPRVGPWLQQVAKTTSVDLRRSRTRRQNREQIRAAIVDQQENYDDAPETASLDELKQKLRDEVDRLPVTYRTPLILFYFGGLSTEQIAVELKTNAKALAVRLFRGRKMLGARLKDRGIVTAGGAVVTLAVADAILGTLANSVFHYGTMGGAAGSAAAVGGGMSASASPWFTSHAAIVNTIVEKVLGVTRVCALAGKWKVSVLVLLSAGAALAGTTETVQGSSLGKSVGGLLQQVGNLLRGGNGSLKPVVPNLRAEAPHAGTPDEGSSQTGVPFVYHAMSAKPDTSPVRIAPLRQAAPVRMGGGNGSNQPVDRRAVASGTSANPLPRGSVAAKGSTTDLLPSASNSAIAINSSSRVVSTGTTTAERSNPPTSEQSVNAESVTLNKPSTTLRDPWNSPATASTRSKLGPAQLATNGPTPNAKSAGTSAPVDQLTGPTTLASASDSQSSFGQQTAYLAGSYGEVGLRLNGLNSGSAASTGPADGSALSSIAQSTGPADVTSTIAAGGDNTLGLIDGTGLSLVDPLNGTTNGTSPTNAAPLNPSGNTVPEPGMIGLAVLAVGGLLCRRRRRGF